MLKACRGQGKEGDERVVSRDNVSDSVWWRCSSESSNLPAQGRGSRL